MMDLDFEKKIDNNKFIKLDLKSRYYYLENIRSTIPFVEQIETTNACDCTCIMCPRGLGKMSRSVGPMSMDLYKKIVDEVNSFFPSGYTPKIEEKKFKFEESNSIDFETTGIRLHHFGEPLLDKYLPERIQYSSEKTNVDVHLSVNPTKLNSRLAERLLKSGLKRIILALDGTNDEEYKSIRGKRVNYDRAVKNTENLINLRNQINRDFIIDIQMIAMKQTKDNLQKFKDFWESKGANVYIKQFFPYPDVKHDEFHLSGDDNFQRGCMFPFTSMTVMKDGKVVPCCSDYDGEITLGDVNLETLEEIWNGENYRKFREDFITNSLPDDSICKRCGFYQFYERKS